MNMNVINIINSIKTQNELNEFRNTINKALNNRENFIKLCEFANNSSLKSFGFIKESFESISPNLFNANGGKKILNKYMNVIKSRKNLSTLHTLYENIRKTNSKSDIQFFLNNIVEQEWNVDKETLNEDVKELGRILAEGILKVGEDSYQIINKNENIKFNNAVEFIAENKKTNKNIAKYSEAMNIIREQIETNPSISSFEKIDLDNYVNNLLESFNKKYNNNLTEDELKVLESISKSDNKENLFNEYKNKCLIKLSEVKDNYEKKGNLEESKKIDEVLNKINKKTFVFENITADICGFAEISKIFD